MIVEPQKTGIFGELYASRYLRNNGYEILVSNYKSKNGEIDIIARKENCITFVEVKTRNNDSFFSPSDAVDELKELNVKNTASVFLSKVKHTGSVSFDIIEVILYDDKYEIRHTQNAF